MRFQSIVAAFALMALGAGVVSAQDPAPVRQSYQVCDWGLLVIEHPAPAQVVDITEPADFSGVPSMFTVSGEGEGLFEGNVVIEAGDIDGNLLASGVGTVAANEIGGRGPWSVVLDLGSVPEATRVYVTAFSTSPEDGAVVAQDVVYLSANSQFGLPYIDIVTPISGDPATLAPLHVEGTAGALFENNFVLEAADAEGNILAQTPVTFAAPDIGLSGPWSADLDVSIEPGSRLTITAYALSMEDGESIVAADVSTVTADPFAQRYERTLVLQAGDPITMDDDICAATEPEFAHDTLTPVNVTSVTAIQTLSMPPTATLLIDWQGPSFCEMPLRLRLVRTGDDYAGELYYGLPEGDGGICTRDLRPYTMYVPLGTQESGVFTAVVNGVALSEE